MRGHAVEKSVGDASMTLVVTLRCTMTAWTVRSGLDVVAADVFCSCWCGSESVANGGRGPIKPPVGTQCVCL